MSMVFVFGQAPWMMKLCSAVKTNWPVEAVRKGELDGCFPCTMQYQRSCSPSYPMTDPISGDECSITVRGEGRGLSLESS